MSLIISSINQQGSTGPGLIGHSIINHYHRNIIESTTAPQHRNQFLPIAYAQL